MCDKVHFTTIQGLDPLSQHKWSYKPITTITRAKFLSYFMHNLPLSVSRLFPIKPTIWNELLRWQNFLIVLVIQLMLCIVSLYDCTPNEQILQKIRNPSKMKNKSWQYVGESIKLYYYNDSSFHIVKFIPTGYCEYIC